MKKFYIFIIIFIFLFCIMNHSYAKYHFNQSAKLFQIDNLTNNSAKPATLSGKILTENIQPKHVSTITLYKASDSNHEQPISQIETNVDGSFLLPIETSGKYDIVVSKLGYLNYTVLQIKIIRGRTIHLSDHKLIVGDFIPNGQIDIRDWIGMLNHNNVPVSSSTEIYDVNCDGVINQTDVDIVYNNYGKKAEVVVWQK